LRLFFARTKMTNLFAQLWAKAIVGVPIPVQPVGRFGWVSVELNVPPVQ
jgi:hypothetical protein